MLSCCTRLGVAARRLAADRSAAVAIEYGLIVALVCIALIAGLGGVNGSVTEMYDYVIEHVSAALAGNN